MNKTVIVQNISDAAVLGSAILAGIGTGAIPRDQNIVDKIPIEKVYTPNAKTRSKYDELYNKFCESYNRGSITANN